MEGVKGLLEVSSIHGVGYLVSEKKLFKLLWAAVVVGSFIAAGLIIRQSFRGWEESPISTTIETRPLSDLAFPEVVVCPAKNSFTTLSPDLKQSESQRMKEKTKVDMLDILTDATFDIAFQEKYEDMRSFYEKDKFLNWYLGTSKMVYPTGDGHRRYYRLQTSAVSGDCSTPFFKESFNENDFLLKLTFQVQIYVPRDWRSNRTISLIIDIDYDIEENEMTRISEYVKVYGSNTKFSDYEELSPNLTKYKREFSLAGDQYYNVVYSRQMYEDELQLWTARRHKGLRVTWYYNQTILPDKKFLNKNQDFIQLVNALQQNQTGVFDKLRAERHNTLNLYHECYVGKLSKVTGHIALTSFSNFSKNPVTEHDIPRDILNTAGKFYFYFNHCPDDHSDMRDFYRDLFDNFSMRTVLVTLARLSLISLETGLHKLSSARVVLKNILDNDDLNVTDYIFWTTKLSYLEEKHLLTDLVPQDVIQRSPDLPSLLSHPAHILDRRGDLSPSALIPFCSFGGDLALVGRKVAAFQNPVCTAFREKVVNDQLCYGIDVNRLRGDVDWEEALHSGLSLVLDTNDEYDVRRLLTEERHTQNPTRDILNSYDNIQLRDKFTIYLNTISTGTSVTFFTNPLSDPVPITLTTEGSFVLTNIKKISVTEDFLSLAPDIKNCQTEQLRTDCVTEQYHKAMLGQCQCVPISLRAAFPENVNKTIFSRKNILIPGPGLWSKGS